MNDPNGVLNSPDSHHVNEDHRASELPDLPSLDKLKVGFDSPPSNDQVFYEEPVRHQPQRLASMDDDAYFSYPNLFASQNSNLGSGTHSCPDNSRSNQQT